jgi:hypothetical protein
MFMAAARSGACDGMGIGGKSEEVTQGEAECEVSMRVSETTLGCHKVTDGDPLGRPMIMLATVWKASL